MDRVASNQGFSWAGKTCSLPSEGFLRMKEDNEDCSGAEFFFVLIYTPVFNGWVTRHSGRGVFGSILFRVGARYFSPQRRSEALR